MFDQDESVSIAISVAIGVAVIFAVVFVLGLLCGLFGLLLNDSGELGLIGQSIMEML